MICYCIFSYLVILGTLIDDTNIEIQSILFLILAPITFPVILGIMLNRIYKRYC